MSDPLYAFMMTANSFSGSWDVVVRISHPSCEGDDLHKTFPSLHEALLETCILLAEFADAAGDFGEPPPADASPDLPQQPKLFH